MDKKKLYEIMERVEKRLVEANVCPNVTAFHEDLPVICVGIEWGDWKHSHRRTIYLLTEELGLTHIDTVYTEDDGSDCYSAIHYFLIPERS